MSGGRHPAGKCVYLVEDDPEVARVVDMTLRDFGFEVQVSRSAAELLRNIERRAPDLCIVDLGLPDMDGMDLVRELQAKHACGILILTGRDYAGDRILGLELGADDYVAKPFDPRELVARVRSILRRVGAAPAAGQAHDDDVVLFSGWRFNLNNNVLTGSDGQASNLSTAEAQLLKAFLARPNRILTREQLLNEREGAPYDRTIDVRISRLRRKLEIDPQNPKLIRTVYGAGYLFSTQVTRADVARDAVDSAGT
ncbi:response regulator transcription factor [Janthinobacterium sp.]|uniref:response regulator transcription factor n=1 Tax=Janthinobacterium sp. TaxID=1871054 RepID=UPI00293D34D6|nr:response regulator transcription factor [Janthinobacterium sp.]